MHNSLLDIIKIHIPITPTDEDLCKKYFQPLSIPKNERIEHAMRVPKYLYFIVSGFIRIFYYNDAGEEITTHINCPPGFITSYSDFINQTPANENVECITACQVLRITKSDLDLLIGSSAAFKDFSIRIFQQSIAYNENRSRELATLTAEQRYKNLILHYPQILLNVPIQHIASFLGMKPESLSRIRKQLNK